MTQQWLPGLEGWLEEPSADAQPRRKKGRSSRAGGRPPSIEKLTAQAPVRVRKLFNELRSALLGVPGIVETVPYDESAGAFMPTYTVEDREVLRLHLEPVLAATITLEPGERQLAKLLASPELSEELKSQAVRCARKSGRRIFLAFLARNQKETAELVTLVQRRVALE